MSALASLERFGEEGLVFINWRYVQTLFTKRMAFKTFFFFPFSSWSFSTDWLYVELWLVELGCYNVRDAHWLPSILLRNTLRNPSQDHELEGNPGIPTRGAHFRISERDNQKVCLRDYVNKAYFSQKNFTKETNYSRLGLLISLIHHIV